MSKFLTLDELQDLFAKQLLSSESVQIFGIIGGSSSGKTTIAKSLCSIEPSSTVLLSQDTFQLGKDFEGRKTSLYKWDDPLNFTLDDCAATLRLLKQGKPVKVPVFDVVANSRINIMVIDPRPNIVWEGIYALGMPELRQLVDTAIYIDTPFLVRLLRRISRFIQSRPLNEAIDYSTPVRQMLTFVHRAENDFATQQRDLADYVVKYDPSCYELDVSNFMATVNKLPASFRVRTPSLALAAIDYKGLNFSVRENSFEISQNAKCLFRTTIENTDDVQYITNNLDKMLGHVD